MLLGQLLMMICSENLHFKIMFERVKQITSPGWMHETSAQGWCTGKTQRKGMEREVGVQVSFSIWHSDIGIPNYIKKLSGIVKIWSSELHVAF